MIAQSQGQKQKRKKESGSVQALSVRHCRSTQAWKLVTFGIRIEIRNQFVPFSLSDRCSLTSSAMCSLSWLAKALSQHWPPALSLEKHCGPTHPEVVDGPHPLSLDELLARRNAHTFQLPTIKTDREEGSIAI